MSGHSKFANIKRKKEKNDAIKGKIFTRLGREIAVAVKEGGPCPNTNSKLKDVIAKAKYNNMPNDTIERNIKKASGDINSINYEYNTYEGYGPKGIAVLVNVLTDNKNRSIANIRSAFTKCGGNVGTSGCVSFLFDKKGLILIEKNDNIIEDELMMLSIEKGAEDFDSQDDYFEIITDPKDFNSVKAAIEEKNIKIESAEISMIPKTYVKLKHDEEDVKKMDRLISLLNEEDDVQDVWHNMLIEE